MACLGTNNTWILPQAFGGEDLKLFSPLKALPTVPRQNWLPYSCVTAKMAALSTMPQ